MVKDTTKVNSPPTKGYNMSRKERMELFFRKYVQKRETNRLGITIFYMSLLALVLVFIGISIIFDIPLATEWKSILALMLGMLISNFSKIVDYWFNSMDNDKQLIDKVDEEDDYLQDAKPKD